MSVNDKGRWYQSSRVRIRPLRHDSFNYLFYRDEFDALAPFPP